MAIYWDDFAGSALGEFPAGWQQWLSDYSAGFVVAEDVAGPAGRKITFTPANNFRRAIYHVAASADADRDDADIRVLIRVPSAGTNALISAACARGSGTTSSTISYVGANASRFNSTTYHITPAKQVASTTTPISAAVSGAFTTDTPFWLRARVIGSTLTVTVAPAENPTSETTIGSGSTDVLTAGNIGIFVFLQSVTTDVLAVGIGTNGDEAPYAAPSGDTTAPTLTSPTGTATGPTSASGTVSTNEATGSLFYLASTNASEGVATVTAASSQAVSATGSQSVSFTGLTASTTYYAHYVHRDAAGNDSAVATSASFTTSAPSGDTTPPTLTGTITISALTTTSYTASWPAGSDNVAVTGYEYRIAAGSWVDAGDVLTVDITGRTPGATETFEVRAYDAAGNRSTPALSTSVTLNSATATVTVTEPLKNNTGTLLASQSGITASVLSASTLASVHTATGLTTNASGLLSAISNASITTGQQYHVAIKLADGGVGITGPITAS